MFHLRRILTLQSSNLRKPIINYQRHLLLSSTTNTSSTSTSPTSSTVTISDNCVKILKELKGEQDKFLRITVDSGGCSGFEYKFAIDTQIKPEEDSVIEKDDCKVVIDTESLEFLKGSTIDYYEEIIRAGFRIIDNPNSEQACSCGTSFSVKL